jgi:hypothetical protein
MPIRPLADFAGVSLARRHRIPVRQAREPRHADVRRDMGGLALSKVGYDRYLKLSGRFARCLRRLLRLHRHRGGSGLNRKEKEP